MPDPGGGTGGIRQRGSSSKKHQKDSATRDIGIQVNVKKNTGRCRSCLTWSLWMVIVVAGVVIAIPSWNILMDRAENLLFRKDFTIGPEMIDDLGIDGVIIFKQHDRDNDGVLSLGEFEPIAHRLLQINDTNEYELPISESDEVITLESFFTPLELTTMSKGKDEELNSGTSGLDSLFGLKYWKQPVKQWKNFAVNHLKPFLPNDPYLLEDVGEAYHLISSQLDARRAPLSSNRYLPPPLVRDQEVMIHRLLSMFHPRPFVFSRFAPQGSVAIVRASSKKYVDIMFRIHAEFQLNQPPFYPFWFTPAQFTGNLIISKDGTKVLSFNLYVPGDKRLNVDMEWLNGPKEQDNMEVDIGYMERMELKATRSSLYVYDGGNNYTNTYISGVEKDATRDIVWEKEITVKQAARDMEVKMYPFKKAAKADQSQPELAAIATQQLKDYRFPVMMMVSLPNGTVVHSVNANEFMDEDMSDLSSLFTLGLEDPSGVAYARFLEEGLTKTKPFLNQ
ncbi:hypothetical protein LSH36_557g01040 [Paralvinella palmiformis]|uniref:EF-hand domain-containing protein n=1 Tax=Paralvinella palmiformis TaxID=53620 RepID=A0AAD9J7L4_9ANNE|nr:hypothetical protein LSH36_557g01040 [Paralvinella palmiformis]